jgi:branched-chain amino acid transport system ATP-binding protein
VLLDEPMAGLGTEDVNRVADLIAEHGRQKTIVMVEHNLKVVERLSDTVTVLCRGEVLAEGRYEEVSPTSACSKPTSVIDDHELPWYLDVGT